MLVHGFSGSFGGESRGQTGREKMVFVLRCVSCELRGSQEVGRRAGVGV